MLAKAVAHHTTASFIRVVGSEFVQKYLGEVRAESSVVASAPSMIAGPLYSGARPAPPLTDSPPLLLPAGTPHGARRLPPGQAERPLDHLCGRGESTACRAQCAKSRRAAPSCRGQHAGASVRFVEACADAVPHVRECGMQGAACGEPSCMEWYCPNCPALLRHRWMRLRQLALMRRRAQTGASPSCQPGLLPATCHHLHAAWLHACPLWPLLTAAAGWGLPRDRAPTCCCSAAALLDGTACRVPLLPRPVAHTAHRDGPAPLPPPLLHCPPPCFTCCCCLAAPPTCPAARCSAS